MPSRLLGRLYLLGAIVALECVACFPDREALFGHQRFLRIAVVSFAVFIGLGYSRLKALRDEIPFGRVFFACHFVCIAAVSFSALAALRGSIWLLSPGAVYARSAVYLLGTVLLALACVPLRVWIATIRATGLLWLYSVLGGVAGWGVGFPFRALWNDSGGFQGGILQTATFNSVLSVIRFFLPNIAADAASFTIGTPRFSVLIAGSCSGMEGLGLVLLFTVGWLWFYRKESRFPQALLLIPCALGCIWLLNIVRLAVLIFIGDAISPEVAMVGFHSQAGWIAFTAVALTFSMATQKLSWVRRASSPVPCPADGLPTENDDSHPFRLECGKDGAPIASGQPGIQDWDSPAIHAGESPAVGAYLLPFLAILAASFVSKAASGYFEWLYPLRFVVAAFVLWHFWPELKKLDWRFGWAAPVAGVSVFLVWIAPSWWAHTPSASPLGPALAALSPAARWSWIACRVAAAVVTVPIAEELAFRGYLARRLVDREFDRVAFSQLTVLSVGLSSVAFGLMHGQHWLVGILAGLAFAAALRWRGRMGDAVAAHAISNLLLAAWVLTRGDWAQW